MRKSTTSLRNCFIAWSIAELMCSCTGNPHRSENKIPVDSAVRTEVITSLPDTTAANAFTGTFEYSQPNEDGYLYYKMELIQQGDSVKGKLYAANYLAYQSGVYTNPNVLMECDVAGSKEEEGGKRFMTILLNVTRYEKMEDGAPFLKEKMNFPDMEVEVDATFWKLMIENDVLKSSNGQLTTDGEMQLLEWERIQ